MSITQLSTEILQKIYEYATVRDVINMSQSSKKNYNAYLGRQLPILRKAVYNSPYAPFPELVKLVISGEPDGTRRPVGTEIRRRITVDRVIKSEKMTSLTLDFIMKMVRYAKVAERWTEIYPQLRWRYDSNSRRLLKPHEAERLRRAIYQFWTYQNLFQDQVYCEFAPEPPRPRNRDDLRYRLVRTWTTIDIVRQSEFVYQMRQLLEIELYPSNTMVQYLFARAVPLKALAKVAWGDAEEHTRLSAALLKFTPGDILHLDQNTTQKPERLDYLVSKGKWFIMNSATWGSAIDWMALDEREYPGRPHPKFPSCLVPWRAPYVDLEDKAVEFGIIDCCEDDGPHYFETHVYNNDASPTGDWIEEWKRPAFHSRFWMEDNTEDEASSDDTEDEEDEG